MVLRRNFWQGSATSPRDRHPSELGTRPPSGWDPHESDVAGRGRPRCGPPGPLIRWGAAGALARAVRALRRRYAPEPQGAAKVRCLVVAAAAGTARCSGPRARSTGAESGPHDRRARAPTSAGAASHGAGPAPAGPLPQGTQTTRWEPRRRQGERAAPRVISSSAVHGRDDRCRTRAHFGGGSISWRRPCAAGPLPQGKTDRWEPRRRQGEMCSPPRAPTECDDGRDDRFPAQAHET